MQRFVSFICILILMSFLHITENIEISAKSNEANKVASLQNLREEALHTLIIEVVDDPKEHQAYIERNFLNVEVVQVYTILFKGIAIKGPVEKLKKVTRLEFVNGIHPVTTYKVTERNKDISLEIDVPSIELAKEINQTNYSGKGVKVGVIDTGVDYSHPDLTQNFKGGYDVVDFDDDPMETTVEQGMATLHGTHVAGIIAANGKFQGIAPDAELYAYRALGPGGMGSSINVIAAMEMAVRDGVDVMNLSLGNNVNGPDYPTSKAVDEAAKLGIAVVVANGNDGPDDWTIGAPATAQSALSVGAYEAETKRIYLYEAKYQRQIPISMIPSSLPWNLTRDYQVSTTNVNGKIHIIKVGKGNVVERVLRAKHDGAIAVLLYNEGTDSSWQLGLQDVNLAIPVALTSAKDGKWLEENENLYITTKSKNIKEKVTDFSSRGPVTASWMIKPDILAPGANVLSTVPGGYAKLSGTSMATPYISGVIALIKEAKPNWSNEQIIGAMKTTARKLLTNNNEFVSPHIQGNGHVDIDKAMQTKTIITQPALNFGKINKWMNPVTVQVEVQNMSKDPQQYHFDFPTISRGLSWDVPQQFILESKEKRKLNIHLKIGAIQLEEGMHQGWLTLHDEYETYHLPYLFVNKTADYPKLMGFDFRLDSLDEKQYTYQLYLPEKARFIRIQLYDSISLINQGVLYEWEALEIGMNEGVIDKREIKQQGYFTALVMIQLENGDFVNYETDIFLE